MDKVTQDFGFDKFSPIYGEFLLEMHNSDPEAVITDVSMHYPFVPNKPLYASVTVSESVAVVLKLRFGAHLKTRPPVIDDTYDALKEYSKLIKFKRNSYYNDNEGIVNLKILKNRNYSKEGYFIDLETFENKIK